MKVVGRIYLITNSVNSKEYIGQTTCTLAQRMTFHRSTMKRGRQTPLYCAMRKYGFDKFKIELLCECATLKELDEVEIRTISERNALSPAGYNLDKGGNRGKHGKETIEKLRRITAESSPEVKKKRADGIRKFWKENPDYYKSPERRRQKSEAMKKRWKGLNKRSKERVLGNLNKANEKRFANKTTCYRHQGRKGKGSTRRFVGVTQRTPNCWQAKLTFEGKHYYKFAKSEEEAARCYDEMARHFFGSHANLNFSLIRNPESQLPEENVESRQE